MAYKTNTMHESLSVVETITLSFSIEYQSLTGKETYLYKKTVLSGTAKKPKPGSMLASVLTGDNKKVFFIFDLLGEFYV
jgi:hypothetical protein